MKIKSVGKIHPSFNSLYNKRHTRPYDIVIMYCRFCKKQMKIKVYYASATFEHFQLVNLPQRVAKHIVKRDIRCKSCDKDFVLEKVVQEEKTDFFLKLDCSNIFTGTEYWYDAPKYSDEEYAL